jgi:hypothetical protein
LQEELEENVDAGVALEKLEKHVLDSLVITLGSLRFMRQVLAGPEAVARTDRSMIVQHTGKEAAVPSQHR